MMIKENKAEFDQARISKYQDLPIKKDPGMYVILDSNGKPRPHDNVDIVLDNFRLDGKSGHNTNVCAVARQVIPNARIVSFNFFSSEKKEIVDWIIENKKDIAVVNCSFSGPTDSEIERLEEHDIIVIASSGNKGNENIISYPSQLPWIISIGAFEDNRNQVADYSNGGEGLDAVAFTDIWFPVTADYSKLHWFNGTSTSGPVAAGMLWLYMSRKGKKLTRQQARDLIHINCIDLLEPEFDNKSGHGLFTLPERMYMEIKGVIGDKHLKVDGKKVIMDTAAIIDSNKRTLVPLRAIGEAFGGEVKWDAAKKEFTIKL